MTKDRIRPLGENDNPHASPKRADTVRSERGETTEAISHVLDDHEYDTRGWDVRMEEVRSQSEKDQKHYETVGYGVWEMTPAQKYAHTVIGHIRQMCDNRDIFINDDTRAEMAKELEEILFHSNKHEDFGHAPQFAQEASHAIALLIEALRKGENITVTANLALMVIEHRSMEEEIAHARSRGFMPK